MLHPYSNGCRGRDGRDRGEYHVEAQNIMSTEGGSLWMAQWRQRLDPYGLSCCDQSRETVGSNLVGRPTQMQDVGSSPYMTSKKLPYQHPAHGFALPGVLPCLLQKCSCATSSLSVINPSCPQPRDLFMIHLKLREPWLPGRNRRAATSNSSNCERDRTGGCSTHTPRSILAVNRFPRYHWAPFALACKP